jgi:hypothetical protein
VPIDDDEQSVMVDDELDEAFGLQLIPWLEPVPLQLIDERHELFMLDEEADEGYLSDTRQKLLLILI